MEKLSWIMQWAQCNHKGPLYKEEVVGSKPESEKDMRRKQKLEKEREKDEDDMLLALQMKERVRSQELWVTSRSWKRLP